MAESSGMLSAVTRLADRRRHWALPLSVVVMMLGFCYTEFLKPALAESKQAREQADETTAREVKDLGPRVTALEAQGIALKESAGKLEQGQNKMWDAQSKLREDMQHGFEHLGDKIDNWKPKN